MSKRSRLIHGHVRHLHGYRRGFHDPRDFLLADRQPFKAASLATKGSTRSIYAPPIRDQSSIGSCSANAGCEAAGFLFHAQTKKPDPLFSRLMLYAETRKIEGTPLAEDSGCYVRDVFKAMAKTGVCLERSWPYQVAKFSKMPPAPALQEGLKHKAVVYLRCAKLADIKASIAAGFPVIGGFTCFQSLESAQVGKTGDVPMPGPQDGEIGGHCILFDGYDDSTKMLNFQNSWGTNWGKGGYGRLPYGYVEQGLADDLWTIRRELV